MTIITLKSENICLIKSVRYADNKCIFTFTIQQKDGNWLDCITESFTQGYYNSVEEYINVNY